MYYLSLLHCNNGCTNASHCYLVHTLPVLLDLASEITIKIYFNCNVVYFNNLNLVYIHPEDGGGLSKHVAINK